MHLFNTQCLFALRKKCESQCESLLGCSLQAQRGSDVDLYGSAQQAATGTLRHGFKRAGTPMESVCKVSNNIQDKRTIKIAT